jgi:tellurite methyltransferase
MEGSSLELDWDVRYREGLYDEAAKVHDLVERFACLIPRHKTVVDIAMGQGRDASFLARSGFSVLGFERSRAAIDVARKSAAAQGVILQAILGDARSLPFRNGQLGAVLVFAFLERAILCTLVDLLAVGGIFLYETFLKSRDPADTNGPRNPAYLLRNAELYERFRNLELLFYEEGIYQVRGKRRALARYAGRKR